MIKWFKNFISEWSERLEYDGLTYEEVCKYAGGGGKGGGSSSRPVTDEERALWDSQKTNLDAMTKIAQEQYNISEEDRNYYEKVFREGTDTEAKNAIAKLKSSITGKEVNPEDIKSSNIDSLLRDTILSATPEFKASVDTYIKNNNLLTDQYGKNISGLSSSFADNLKSYTANYGKEVEQSIGDYNKVLSDISGKYGVKVENATTAYGQSQQDIANKFGTQIADRQASLDATLSDISSKTGTINQDVLARETGANLSGVSSSYSEARKQMTSDLARRGLAGSGVEANILAQNYQSEAMAKANASAVARANALNQSEAIRQQQASLAGQLYQSGYNSIQGQANLQQQALTNAYNANISGAGNIAQMNASTAQSQYGANQAGAAGMYQANTSALQAGYNSQLGSVQNIYGVTTANSLQNYQLQNASMLQGISGLTQLAQAGQGVYAGAQNYLAQAGSTSGQAAQIAGSSASNLAQVNSNYALQQQANANAASAGIGKLVGTLGGAYLGSASGSTALTGGLSSLGTSVAGLFSDERLKTNIQLVDNINGYNIYTWDWIEGYDYGYNKGVLAQEIMETNPEAVSLMDNGYYQVNYSKLGLEALIQGVNNGI